MCESDVAHSEQCGIVARRSAFFAHYDHLAVVTIFRFGAFVSWAQVVLPLACGEEWESSGNASRWGAPCRRPVRVPLWPRCRISHPIDSPLIAAKSANLRSNPLSYDCMWKNFFSFCTRCAELGYPQTQITQLEQKPPLPNMLQNVSWGAESVATAEMGQTKCETPYGAWKSPLTADFVSGSSKRLGGGAVDSDGRLIWLEGRPSEAGSVRNHLSCCPALTHGHYSHGHPSRIEK